MVERIQQSEFSVLNRESSKSQSAVKSSVGCHVLYKGENCSEYRELLDEWYSSRSIFKTNTSKSKLDVYRDGE